MQVREQHTVNVIYGNVELHRYLNGYDEKTSMNNNRKGKKKTIQNDGHRKPVSLQHIRRMERERTHSQSKGSFSALH